MRKPIPALVGSLVRSSFICGLELELGGKTVTPQVCCPAEDLPALSPPNIPLSGAQDAPQPELSQHPGARQLAHPAACGISLVHQRTEEVSGLAGLGQQPWLALLGNTSAHFSNTNINCLGVLVGRQVV